MELAASAAGGDGVTEYHKIQSLWKRDERGKVIVGDWARPEIGYLASCEWEWTEKVDGTNIRIGQVSDGEGGPLNYFVGGRTDAAQIPTPLLAALDALDLRRRLPEVFGATDVVLYGEGYGAKIQKGGGNYRPDQGFVLFDVRVGDWWLAREGVEDVAGKLGLAVVPVVGFGTLHQAIDRVARGLTSHWGAFEAEGLVCRPAVPMFARDGSRVIVKVKSKDLRGRAS
jgi:hypothetical protein